MIVGLNPFRGLHEVFDTIWQRCEPETFQRAKLAAEQQMGKPVTKHFVCELSTIHAYLFVVAVF